LHGVACAKHMAAAGILGLVAITPAVIRFVYQY
jgi:hypothetical protein